VARRVIVMPSQADSEERAFDSWLPGEGLLQESLALAGIVFIALEVVLFAVAYLVQPLSEAVVTTLGAAPLVAALAAVIALVLAVYRVLRYERRERRHMALLDAQVEEAWRRLPPEEEQDTPLRHPIAVQPSDIHYWDGLAYEVLRRYYTVLSRTGDPNRAVTAISRRVIVKEGLCSQPDWNELNRLLQERGIRGKRYLIPKTFEEAWRLWRARSAQVSGWYVREDGVWVPKE